METFDVIIVGGGLVGTTLAIALHRIDAALKVALIEAKSVHPATSIAQPTTGAASAGGGCERFFALSYASCMFLHHLDVWSSLKQQAEPIHAVHVSRERYFGALRLRREALQLPALGYVIPAQYIDTVLSQRLTAMTGQANQANLTLYQPATVQSVQCSLNATAQITLATSVGQHIISAPIIIGADGTDSTVRQQLQLCCQKKNYQQLALVLQVMLQQPHAGIAYERFTAGGTLAMLPLGEKRYAAVWSGRLAEITSLHTCSDEQLLARMQAVMGDRLGRFTALSSHRAVFPLHLVYTEPDSLPKQVLLIGNAAHTLHPIAAQGFNLALYEIAVICAQLRKSTTQAQRPWLAHVQVIKQTLRQQCETSLQFTDCLANYAAGQSMVPYLVWQSGLIALDKLLWLKHKLFHYLAPYQATGI